jgi:2-phosphosulfolactate phosphatase
LLRKEQKDTVIVCAGTRGERSLEDTVCGGMLLDSLDIKKSTDAEKAVSFWCAYRKDLTAMMKNDSLHGRSLVKLGLERDIDFAARLNEFNIIPVRQGDSIVRRENHG